MDDMEDNLPSHALQQDSQTVELAEEKVQKMVSIFN